MLFKTILVGYGKIGRDLTSLIAKKKKELKQYDLEIMIIAALDSSGGVVDPLGLNLETLNQVKQQQGRLCNYPKHGREDLSVQDAIAQIDDSNLLVEMTPTDFQTGQPGISNISLGIESGLNIVTTNKGALALAFPKLKKAAQQAQLFIRYTGAAATPLPTTELEEYAAMGLRMTRIESVVNACTNLILARMLEGVSKVDAIEEARNKGLLESNPDIDLNGWDTACKMVITANMLLDAQVTLADVQQVSGLNTIESRDVMRAKENNQVLKHRGMVERSGEKVRIVSDVKPYPRSHMFSRLEGSAKAMIIQTANAAGFTYMSEQVGSLPSAEAILSDITSLQRSITAR